jgi:hypothetical protein
MRIPRISMPSQLWRAVLLFALGYFVTGTFAEAQCNTTTQGFNTVYGSCNSTAKQGSFALVDASQYLGTGDICNAIEQSINKLYPSGNTINYGIIVDARGINPGTPQSCGSNPFDLRLVSAIPPSTVVLLPSGTITISATWTLPAYTRLVGEGPGVTTLQVNSQGFTGSDMIDMGTTSTSYNSYNCTISGTVVDCPGVAIEHLGLNGLNQSSVNGIVNTTAQELSYVDDVVFSNIPGVALSLLSNAGSSSQNGGNSQNSGPYSNLTMSNVGTCVTISADITIPFDTRGIHGLNCSTSASLGFAIYLNASNNSLEDISLTTANTNADGILIGNLGASGSAQNNVLFNISAGGFANVIHISPHESTAQNNCPAQANANGSPAYNVCDITIMAVTKSSSTATIKDEISGATLTDPYLGMYILGEPVQSGSASGTSNNTVLGNSYFTTSPNLPTWVVGANMPSHDCPNPNHGTTFSNVGSLYSATSSSSGTLWECESTGWVNVK